MTRRLRPGSLLMVAWGKRGEGGEFAKWNYTAMPDWW